MEIKKDKYGKMLIEEGTRFNKWTIIKEARKKNGRRCFWCKCDCGNESIVRLCHLISGASTGCFDCRKTGHKTHGQTNTRLYRIWCGMKTRCNDSNYHAYKNYGAKGVKVCEEWAKDYTKFAEWSVRNGYDETLTIDRIDCFGDYTPDNCRWTDIGVQSNNKRNSLLISFNGQALTKSQWEDTLGFRHGLIKDRMNAGWSMEKILTTPLDKKKSEGLKEYNRRKKRL